MAQLLSERTKKLYYEIKRYLRSNFPALYFYTYEERELLSYIEQLAEDFGREIILTFDLFSGLRPLKGTVGELEYEPRKNILEALRFLNQYEEEYLFVVFLDAHSYIKENLEVIRGFKNLISKIKETNLHTLFFISPLLSIPTELEKDIVIIDFPLPDKEEIKVIIENVVEEYKIKITDFLKTSLIESLNGLTRDEIKYLLYFSITDDLALTDSDIKNIMLFKKQIIKKGGFVELIEVSEIPDNIGGLKNLKDWLLKKQRIFKNLEKAKNVGVDIPKGVLLVGMPGCGKSLTAKACSSIFELPLLRLDMGAIFGPYLGQSEENIRKVIKLTENIAPCILWIDEIEKGFAGVGGSGSSSSEVTTRIFGTILTWMQEKAAPVFVIATSNDISLFPPEFLRKGRFDEIFYVDFPDKEALKQIIQIHFSKRGWKGIINNEDIALLCQELAKRNFSGADAESLVAETIEEIFIEKLDKFSNVETEIKCLVSAEEVIKKLNEIAKKITPISEARKDVIDKMKELFEKYKFKKAN